MGCQFVEHIKKMSFCEDVHGSAGFILLSLFLQMKDVNASKYLYT